MTIIEAKNEPAIAEILEHSPQEAANFIRNNVSESIVVVDFDETLLLRNSTEEYLNTISPRTFAAVVLLILDLLKPWNWLPGALGGPENRDWFRVVILTLLFPWNLLRWGHCAKIIAQSYANQELIHAIEQRPNSQVVIVTKGFNFIVQPIVKYLPIAIDQTIGCRFWLGFIDRKAAKESLM